MFFCSFFNYSNAKWNDGWGDTIATTIGGALTGIPAALVTRNPYLTTAAGGVGALAGQTAWNYTYDNWVPDDWKCVINFELE